MSDQDDSAEKSHEPSQRKLEEARKKGEIPRTPDLVTAMGYLGLLAGALSVGAHSLQTFATALLPLIEQPDRFLQLTHRDGSSAVTGMILASTLTPALPILLIPGAAVLLTLLATRGLLFTGSKLTPKFSRLSPVENAKNKYGRRGLFEFAKSFAKLSLYSICLAVFLATQIEEIAGLSRAEPAQVLRTLLGMMVRFLSIVLLIAASLGVIDALWQRADHNRRNRMSQKEVRDEHKEAEGDPHLKQHRRARAQEIAMNQMMADVPKADVVIVNPTHFAVALKWSRVAGSAPVCVAKGQDAIAARIREVAAAARVPILSDPPTARALYAMTEIGREIAPEHYKAVAAAIRFAEEMRRKARERGGI